jgi:hypothetical protein
LADFSFLILISARALPRGAKGSEVTLFWGGFGIDKKIVLNSFDSQNLFAFNFLLLLN